MPVTPTSLTYANKILLERGLNRGQLTEVAGKIDKSPLSIMILNAIWALDSTAQNLCNAGQRLSEQMASMIDTVNKGQHVNSLGEVQSRGMDVDRYCALMEERTERLLSLLWLYQRSTKVTEGV